MNRRRAAIIGILLIVAILVIWYFQHNTNERDTVVVQRGSIDVTIQTVGTLEPIDPVVVRSTTKGSIQRIGASAGDFVEKDDIIAILDQAPFNDAVDEASAALESAEFALQVAERQAADMPDSSELQLAVVTAKSKVDSAKVTLEKARQSLEKAVIVAPISGIVLDVAVENGQPVDATTPIAHMYAVDALQLIAQVDELDLPNVALGASATFRLDSFPADEISGTVANTAPQATSQGGSTIFPTRIVFDPPSSLDLRPGMNADVTIVTGERTDVPVIPESAITTVGDRAFVTVVNGGEHRQVEVILGYRANGMAEVASGVDVGDVLLLR